MSTLAWNTQADTQLIDKTARLAQLESPRDYLTAYATSVIDDFNRRTRGAIGALRRSGLALSMNEAEAVHTARALLDELLNLDADRQAHDGRPSLYLGHTSEVQQ